MSSPDYTDHYFSQPACTLQNRPSRDILWDRTLFRAPSLFNFRVIFDPPPFRSQHFAGRRTGEAFTQEDSHAA